MRIAFIAEARGEFDEAERYFERQVPGLGARFRVEVQGALRRLRRWPLAAPVEQPPIRRLVLGRFPYKLLYVVEGDVILILAVAHQHRAPSDWTPRMPR